MVQKLIWLLQGPRFGDNAQAFALAQALNISFIVKQLQFNSFGYIPNFLLGQHIRTVVNQQILTPPWPDMVIGTARRMAPVALWIKAQSKGRSKLVHLGRPRMPLNAFDLVITTPQYGLPILNNVHERLLPFSTAIEISDDERDCWSQQWRDLPRPLIMVGVGGAKFPLQFGRTQLCNLGKQIEQLAKNCSGAVLLIGSPRTDPLALSTISRFLSIPFKSYPYQKEARNPYKGALKLADRIVLTSDSISMIADGLKLDKKISLFQLPHFPVPTGWMQHSAIIKYLSAQGIFHQPRNVSALIEQLYAQGLVDYIGEGESGHARAHYSEDETSLERVKALLL